MDKAMLELSKRFYATLTKPAYPVPSFYQLMAFRVSRTHIKKMLDDSNRDYRYYAEKGWLESEYFYPTHLGLLKSAAGNLFDRIVPTILKIIA